MNVVSLSAKKSSIGVSIAERPEDLDTIHSNGCAAVIWRRQPTPVLQAWINDLDAGHLPHVRTIIEPGTAAEITRFHCQAADMPDGPQRNQFIGDIAALAETFAGITGTPYLRFRLERVTTNACRKFHIDAVTTRLICTYRGTGTQYGISQTGAEPKRVFTVPTGAPIILRGTEYPDSSKSGLLHRSPPIEGTGETRLLLVLDPVAQAQDWI